MSPRRFSLGGKVKEIEIQTEGPGEGALSEEAARVGD